MLPLPLLEPGIEGLLCRKGEESGGVGALHTHTHTHARNKLRTHTMQTRAPSRTHHAHHVPSY